MRRDRYRLMLVREIMRYGVIVLWLAIRTVSLSFEYRKRLRIAWAMAFWSPVQYLKQLGWADVTRILYHKSLKVTRLCS